MQNCLAHESYLYVIRSYKRLTFEASASKWFMVVILFDLTLISTARAMFKRKSWTALNFYVKRKPFIQSLEFYSRT